jgi:hypothetical protein
MQKLILLLVLFLGSWPSFSQNCTDPDTLAPVVTCRSGLLVGVDPATCGILLPVETVLDTVLDDCSPIQNIQLSLREGGTGTGFPLDSAGNPVASIGLYLPAQQVVLLELWARDAAGHAAYCQTTINVWDSEGDCLVDVYSAGGGIATAPDPAAQAVEGVQLTLEAAAPAFPPFSLYQQTAPDGSYLFSNVLPEHTVYHLIPYKNDDPLNGVTTYDLVLISRHLLGLEPLDNPYKIIAADANKSGTVTAFDIITLRKLILGLTPELPNNTSWRFIDRAHVFPNPNNPFQTLFPESILDTIDGIDLLDDDFVALKVGDVNASAAPNSVAAPDDRSEETVYFYVAAAGGASDRWLEPGEQFSLKFSPASLLSGFQFTLNTSSLDVLDLQPNAAMSLENFAVFADRAALTVSWNVPATLAADPLPAFTVIFRATRPGRLTDLLDLSGRITPAEAYGAPGRMKVALRFDEAIVRPAGLELEQNEPNPFRDETVIGFHLPEAGEAVLTIFDANGRELYRRAARFAAGRQSFKVNGNFVPGAGWLYYKIETAGHSATRKMVLLR